MKNIKIEKRDHLQRVPNGEINPKSTYILGVDVARTGADETALVILEQIAFDTNIFVSHIETLKTPDLNMAIGRVLYLDRFFNFKKIIIDETGLGAGVVDILKAKLNYKVEGIWYTQKLKAEMFTNLKLLMMRKDDRLYLPDYLTMNDSIIKKMHYQFLSIYQEYKDGDATRTPKIKHESRSHDDIVNAIALAATYFKIGGTRNRGYVFSGYNYT